jgi:hypothetical protein
MRPNLPSQIAQRLAATLQRYWRPLRIVVSSEPCVGVGSGCCSPLGRRTCRPREEPLDFAPWSYYGCVQSL